MLTNILQVILPERLKEILFRGAYRLMSPNTRFAQTDRFQMISLDRSLQRLKDLGFEPHRVLDIGAYKGIWTATFKMFFPDATVVMIEAQEERKNALETICHQHQNVTCHIATLGRASNESRTFYQTRGGTDDTTGSSLYEEISNIRREQKTVQTTALDDLFSDDQRVFDLIKIDVQGAEREVLEGGSGILERCKALLLELSFQHTNTAAPLFHEMISFLSQKGFLAYDICTLMRSPDDGRLLQIDMLFFRSDSPLMQTKAVEYV